MSQLALLGCKAVWVGVGAIFLSRSSVFFAKCGYVFPRNRLQINEEREVASLAHRYLIKINQRAGQTSGCII